MDKLKAVRRLLLSSNYVLLTDTTTDGSVSPLYADKFIDKLESEVERQRLAGHKHSTYIQELADSLLEQRQAEQSRML